MTHVLILHHGPPLGGPNSPICTGTFTSLSPLSPSRILDFSDFIRPKCFDIRYPFLTADGDIIAGAKFQIL